MAYIYQCEDSPEGVFTAIYNIYEDRHNLPDTCICLEEEYRLFAEYISVETDCEKAVKVMRTVRERFGEEDFYDICMALSSPDMGKAQAVYKTIAYGLKERPARGHLFDHLSDDQILKASGLALAASRETCHLRGFTRFRELENGVLYAQIAPKNHIITALMDHFSDRFPSENFAIFDENRKVYGIHPCRQQWFLAMGKELEERFNNASVSPEEEKYAELFRYFCKTIAIRERKNIPLQRNMLPLRFREYMTEFK